MDAIKALHLEVKRLKEQNARLRIENRRLEWYKVRDEVREKTLYELSEKVWKLEMAELERKEHKTVTIPFLAVGNEELEGQPDVKKGDMFDCPHCPGKHPLECGKNEKGEESDLLLFYKCTKTGNTYLVGFHGKVLPIKMKGEKN